jgi:ankyrin repeat protein
LISTSETPLYLAVCGGNSKVLELLFACGGTLPDDIITKAVKSPFARAVKLKQIDCLVVLLKRGLKPLSGGESQSPLMNAIVLRLYDAIEPLLLHGADPNFVSATHACALFLAIKSAPLHIVELLISKNANIHFVGPGGATALHAACQSGNLAIVKLVLNNGVDPTAMDDRQRIATFSALMAPPGTTIPILMYLFDELHLDINAKDKDDTTFLLEAVTDKERMTPEMADFLLKRGANMSLKGRSGRTAFEVVMEGGAPELKTVFNHYANKSVQRPRG